MSESAKQPDPEQKLRESESPYHLDLPDAPDFYPEPSQMRLDDFLNWLEEMRRMFPLTDEQRAIREQARCTQEFIL